MRAYKYRICPTKQQDIQMRSHLWLSKQLWNELLAHTKEMHKEYGHFATKASLREMVKRCGLYSQAAQELVDRLLDAMGRYFRLKALGIGVGFPIQAIQPHEIVAVSPVGVQAGWQKVNCIPVRLDKRQAPPACGGKDKKKHSR